MPPSKGHKKSRRGCLQCKRRHVKCDETRPSCQRCDTAARPCTYLAQSSPADTQGRGTGATSAYQEYDIFMQTDTSLQLTPLSILHLELLYNFEHHACRTIASNDLHIEVYRRTIMNRIFKVPYLLQAMLGVSALHLSLQDSPQTSLHKRAATMLQSQALAEFNTGVLDNVNAENVLDVLLFQHLTALHVFCDTFTCLHADFGEFLERLVGCIQLLRGVNAVVQSWWHVLSRTELGVVMENSDSHQNSPHKTDHECLPLSAMLDNADLSIQSIEICRSSVQSLQLYFDAENDLKDQAAKSTNMLFAWLITASPEYTSLLQQRRPEALIILSFYAVLLHRRQQSWAVADSGSNLLQNIEQYLGNTWSSHLSWPRSAISA